MWIPSSVNMMVGTPRLATQCSSEVQAFFVNVIFDVGLYFIRFEYRPVTMTINHFQPFFRQAAQYADRDQIEVASGRRRT